MNISEAIRSAIECYKSGNLQQAESICKEILKIQPNNADVLYFLGVIYFQLNDCESTIQFIKEAVSINSNNIDAYIILGVVYQRKCQIDEAITCYQKVLDLDPNFVNAFYNLGIAFQDKGQLDEAISYYQKVLELNPNDAEAYYNLGTALVEKCILDKATTAFDMAISKKPNYVAALWARCMSRLPPIYPDQSSIETSRQRYREELLKLCDTISLETQQDIESAVEAIGSYQPFFLPCQGYNDRELQKLYGDLLFRIMALRYPQFAKCPANQILLPGEPIRVGVVSHYFYHHSVWKIPIKGWVENLNKKRFKLYGYYTGKTKDTVTVVAMQCFSRFVEDIYGFEELCQIIRNDNLHILIYPEIGMDPRTLKLASLRLSPVQCVSLGHPDTSGLPTIDYYISSDLMEPPDADDHYTEQLISLPNLSVYYTPLRVQPMAMNRDTFGLRLKSVLYLCSHALFTYLPQYDEVFPRIAQQVKDCQFLFISHKSNFVTEQFHNRIKQAFNQFNLNADSSIIFLPRLDQQQYHAVNCLSDIFLDSIGWSANNSTFEAIACNLPVVTFPGRLMRQRHCAAILTMLGLTETIASSVDDYVNIAARLGRDPEWRRHISEKITANKHRIYRDKTCIAALEDFLERAVREKLG